MEHLDGLNPKQKEAASHTTGPLLIIAGAGAGKTKTITHRIVNLIKTGIEPHKILAVTFTNKAAKEMRERVLSEIHKNIGGQNSIPFVSTFHSLGVYILKENARILGLTKHFSILDESDANAMIKDILKEKGLDPKQYEPKKIKSVISREKGKGHEIDYFEEITNNENYGSSHFNKIVADIWRKYESRKNQENSLDFDDLLLKTLKLLKENQNIRENYQNKWTHIHIDEYQDTNDVQYRITKILSDKNKNICVVGDADQNIYSWRGANLKNILSFEKDYKDASIVLLEENYRSTQNILEAANTIIKKNQYRPDKNLFTKNASGEKIGLYEALDEGDEAEFVATKILEIIDTGEQNIFKGNIGSRDGDGQRKFEASNFRGESKNILLEGKIPEIAILYRANFQSRAFEEAMLRYNIPYQVLGVRFFERKEIRDTLAYLRSALNPQSLADIKRIINFPARGIGKTTLVKLFAGEQESLPIKMQLKIKNFYELLEDLKNKISEMKASEIIKYLVKKTGIEMELQEGGEEEMERLENIKELATLAVKYDALPSGQGIEKLLEDASLASDQDSLIINTDKKEEKRGVKLMTVHASKGLEFDYVFIVGLESGLFPHERMNQVDSKEDSEEERRLFYVALTRARHKLFLTFANFRTIFGSRQINSPSEFILDIPKDLLEREREELGIKTIYI